MESKANKSNQVTPAGEQAPRPEAGLSAAGIMAKSVTRHDGITKGEDKCLTAMPGPHEWELLAAGVDSLDLGLYVDWQGIWSRLFAKLEKGKEQASGTKGVACGRTSLGEAIILPAGRARYPWHLQWPALHLWLARQETPCRNTPNAYCSINSHTLWQHGLTGSIELVERLISDLRGKLLRCVPSRCDLCADFRLPSGLELNFLRETTVARSSKRRHYLDGDRLETWYVGDGGAPIQFRIYDKSLEINHPGGKLWMWDVWGLKWGSHVWRVEIQLMRKPLRQYGIADVTKLVEQIGGIWKDLTTHWCSLRLQDDSNITRRTVHPWWKAVQNVGERFGQVIPVSRNLQSINDGTVEWYRSHISGCLLGYAALQGLPDLEQAIESVGRDARTYWSTRDWPESYIVAAVRRGLDVEIGDDIPI